MLLPSRCTLSCEVLSNPSSGALENNNRLGAPGLRATPRFAAAGAGAAALRERQGGFGGAGFHQAPLGIIM